MYRRQDEDLGVPLMSRGDLDGGGRGRLAPLFAGRPHRVEQTCGSIKKYTHVLPETARKRSRAVAPVSAHRLSAAKGRLRRSAEQQELWGNFVGTKNDQMGVTLWHCFLCMWNCSQFLSLLTIPHINPNNTSLPLPR